jgi:hypothetical protein
VTLAWLYVAAIAGMVFWGVAGFKFASDSRAKRNSIIRLVVEKAVANAKEKGYRPPDALDVLRLMDQVHALPDRDIWNARVVTLGFEWARDDPAD